MMMSIYGAIQENHAVEFDKTADRLAAVRNRAGLGACVDGNFETSGARSRGDFEGDRIAQLAAILLGQLVAWLGLFFVGYALLLWPFVSTGVGSAFSMASPGVFGPDAAVGNAQKVLADLAAFTALVAVTLQIAYLPTLYSEFNSPQNA